MKQHYTLWTAWRASSTSLGPLNLRMMRAFRSGNCKKRVHDEYKWFMTSCSQVAHQAGAYPGFRSMELLGVFLLPLALDASPSQGYPFIRLGRERHCESKTFLPRARTQTARSGDERTNHEATAPPTVCV